MIKEFGELNYKIITTPYGRLRLPNVSYENYVNAIYRLEKSGVVKILPNRRVRVSKAGLKLLLPSDLKKRKDGLSTIVIFDIPESKVRTRRILTRYLIKNGFTRIQKSVFVSEYFLDDRFGLLLNKLKIKNIRKNYSRVFYKITKIVRSDQLS